MLPQLLKLGVLSRHATTANSFAHRVAALESSDTAPRLTDAHALENKYGRRSSAQRAIDSWLVSTRPHRFSHSQYAVVTTEIASPLVPPVPPLPPIPPLPPLPPPPTVVHRPFRHAWFPPHTLHVSPLAPHALGCCPPTQLPDTSQQPLRQEDGLHGGFSGHPSRTTAQANSQSGVARMGGAPSGIEGAKEGSLGRLGYASGFFRALPRFPRRAGQGAS